MEDARISEIIEAVRRSNIPLEEKERMMEDLQVLGVAASRNNEDDDDDSDERRRDGDIVRVEDNEEDEGEDDEEVPGPSRQ